MPSALDLFERHHVAVFRFLRRMGLGPADAEDATQDVFLRVVQALPGYEERQSERALSYVAADGSNEGVFADGGEQKVRVQPGEAVRIELPGLGESGASSDPRVPRMTQDLAGHSFALIVTAKPVS
jgi:hypothetical protein